MRTLDPPRSRLGEENHGPAWAGARGYDFAWAEEPMAPTGGGNHGLAQGWEDRADGGILGPLGRREPPSERGRDVTRVWGRARAGVDDGCHRNTAERGWAPCPGEELRLHRGSPYGDDSSVRSHSRHGLFAV
ncbi:hypothetical protein GCM10018965_032750 [Nonomuraea roseola]